MKVLAFVPLPPPLAGPEIATQLMLERLSLPPGCLLQVVKANVRLANERRGNFDWQGIWRTARSLGLLFFNCLRVRPDKVYLLISSSKAGFLRDAAAILIAKLFFCQVVGHYHGSNFQCFYRSSPGWYRWVIRIGLKCLDQMMVQAHRLKNIFVPLLPEAKMVVLYNGVADACLERGKAAIEARQGQSRDVITFLFLGHISFTKGFYHLLTAYKELVKQRKAMRLLVAGDFILNPKTQVEFLEEPYRQFYQKDHEPIHREILDFIQDFSVHSVEFHGLVTGEKKDQLFAQSDVFILPSYTEGFPNGVLEAMAFGLGLIVTPVGALAEILQEPDHALFVKRGDSADLQRQMDRLITDPQLPTQMGRNNRKLVEQNFRMTFTSRRFADILFHPSSN